MDDLFSSFRVSASGMKVQGARLRVISENIANADSDPTRPGEAPYRRKKITFKNVFDRAAGTDVVQVDRVVPDRSEFGKRFDPGHPAADQDGYVRTPNVNTLIEVMDMREAQRSYEANLNVIRTTKSMLQRTIDILR
jgi:flagellar basal-body rod protein FlgC